MRLIDKNIDTPKKKSCHTQTDKMIGEQLFSKPQEHTDMPPVNTITKKLKTEKTSREDAKRQREKHFNNVRQVLWCSNATPISTHGDGGYKCLYCDKSYPDPADLKEHTLMQHKDEDIINACYIGRVTLARFYVKLDITGLKCTLCDADIDTLELLLEHIRKIHHKTMYKGINNRMVPFKFGGAIKEQLTCFKCLNVFSTFKGLLEHMNSHYRNFICEICDAGFVTRELAVAHTKRHIHGTFECKYCTKVYDTKTKQMNHERVSHTKVDMLNKCGICEERFRYYEHKQKHLMEVHGVVVEAKCQACERVFDTYKKLQIHIRKQHLMDKRYQCTHCDKKFFKSTELKDHIVKHNGLKEFQCNECLKSYSRRKALLAHMKVIHFNKQIMKIDTKTKNKK